MFDLGGGTLDVSLLEVGNGTIEVLSTGLPQQAHADTPCMAPARACQACLTHSAPVLKDATAPVCCCAAGGDAHLGGDDWDAAIVQWLQRQYLQPADVDTSSPSMAARLRALAEYAKVSLSDSEQVVLRWAWGRVHWLLYQ